MEHNIHPKQPSMRKGRYYPCRHKTLCEFMRVEEVAQELGISKSHAYKVIHKLNAELREKGYLTISGRVNRNFFMEKFCYGKTGKEG